MFDATLVAPGRTWRTFGRAILALLVFGALQTGVWLYAADATHPAPAVAFVVFVGIVATFGSVTRMRAWGGVLVTAVAALLLRQAGILVLSHFSVRDPANLRYLLDWDTGTTLAIPLAVVTGLLLPVIVRSRTFPVVAIVVQVVLVGAVLWPQAEHQLVGFTHPTQVGIAGLIVAILIVAQFPVRADAYASPLSVRTPTRHRIAEPRRRKPGRVRLGLGSLVLVVLPLVVGLLYLGFAWMQSAATALGGGLLQPTLLGFDFSDFVNLEPKISLNSDLVLLYRTDRPLEESSRDLLRRHVLEGYDERRGFIATTEVVPFPDGPSRYPVDEYEGRVDREQEVFFVNLDPTGVIALNEPEVVLPFDHWDDSSFTGLYRVISTVPEVSDRELGAYRPDPSGDEDRLGSERYDTLTDFGDDVLVRELAASVTADIEGYYDRVLAVERYLKEEYHYSLSPGIAPDDNQLHHFLFESKRGYCSYFAFSMTLMLRSLGIPARVAVGFFNDVNRRVLDFYPVRGTMAHAWTEVYFGRYGWIEFDPTSATLAPGEEPVDGSGGASDGEVYDLVAEVLRNQLTLRSVDDQAQPVEVVDPERRPFVLTLRYSAWIPAAVVFAYAVYLLLAWRVVRRGDESDLAMEWVRRMFAHLHRAGFRAKPGESASEAAGRFEDLYGFPARRAVAARQRALFSENPDAYGSAVEAEAAVRAVLVRLREKIGSLRYALCFFLPPPPIRLAATTADDEGSPRPASRARSDVPRRAGVLLFVIGLVVLPIGPNIAQNDAGVIGGEGEIEPPQDVESILQTSRAALRTESYEIAVETLLLGQRLFPDEWRLNKALGDIYFERELFQLALEQYQAGFRTGRDDYDLVYQLAETRTRLNQDQRAIEVFRFLLGRDAKDVRVIGRLGWLLYKVHRLDEAEEVLQTGLEVEPNNRYLLMTLGTVYAGMYRYDSSRDAYTRSIELAESVGADQFASIGYYNLSLLERAFYRFDSAIDGATRSLEAEERASGYLSLGELHEARMSFTEARDAYDRAFMLDTETPLSAVNLASLYERFGLLPHALSYAVSARDAAYESWLYNYGTDTDRFLQDVYEILAETHSGRARQRRFLPPRTTEDVLRAAGQTIADRVLAWYYRRLYYRTSLDVAANYLRQGQLLDGYWTQYRAAEAYRRPALSYLRAAEDREVAIIPEAAPTYRYERAVLNDDTALLAEAIDAFDPEWEQLVRHEARIDQVLLSLRRPFAYFDDTVVDQINTLYRENPGSLLPNGIELPVRVSTDGSSAAQALRRLLVRSGFRAVRSDAAAEITISGGDTLQIRLTLPGLDDRAFTVPSPASDRSALVSVAIRVRETFFSPWM